MKYMNAVIVCLCVYALNFCHKLADCALVFSVLVLTLNAISERHGAKRAMGTVLLSIIGIGIGLLWHTEYVVAGHHVQGLQWASFLSVMVSGYCSISLVKKLKPVMNFPLRNLMGMLTAGFLDSIIMSGFLVNYFSTGRVLVMFGQDLGYKCAYAGILSLGVYMLLRSTSKISPLFTK